MVKRKDLIEQCAPQFHPQITLQRVVSEAVEHTLYFVCGVHLYALNAGTGALKWGLSISRAPQKLPAVSEGTIFTGPGQLDGLVGLEAQQDKVFVSSHNSFVYALAAVDGAVIWRHSIDCDGGMPTIAGETIYVAMGTIYALNMEDGVERWTFRTQDVVSSKPVIVDDTLYTGSYGNIVYALNIENGQARWTYQTDGRVYIAPVVDQGTLYAGAGNAGRRLFAIDTESGKLKWEAQSSMDVTGQLLVQDIK